MQHLEDFAFHVTTKPMYYTIIMQQKYVFERTYLMYIKYLIGGHKNLASC